ncbi:hypothetical protein J1614_000009 [Plenodomus biglobosus]|nr:hypothetical protein J1614_000009 [Plenodomus biglobosus]
MSSDNLLTKLLRRLHLSPRSSSKKCHFLDAPAEVRLLIYSYIAPQSFLPFLPYKQYMGLFLSCKQIHGEMVHETLNAAPTILQAIQSAPSNKIMLVRPLHPHNFSSLMHISVGVPRWSLYSIDIEYTLFDILSPLMKLHLSSLTIVLDGLSCTHDFTLMSQVLTPTEQGYWDDDYTALDDLLLPNTNDYYDVHTTYAEVVGFAAVINCLLAPSLCNGGHHAGNRWCIRATSPTILPDTVCNIQKVVFKFKRFHRELRCHCSELPHYVYSDNRLSGRWMPADEETLRRQGKWRASWVNRDGSVNVRKDEEPSRFQWDRVAEKSKKKPWCKRILRRS